MKLVINRCWGGYCLSKEAYDYLGLKWDNYGYAYTNDRGNPNLIKCVEALGEKANGVFAKLKVVEIPNNVDWYIDDYDGMETIVEEHEVWY